MADAHGSYIHASAAALTTTASIFRRESWYDAKIRSLHKRKKPGIGLYVRKGSGLPDFADSSDWIFSGTAEQDLLPSSVVEGVETNGHAFRNMG